VTKPLPPGRAASGEAARESALRSLARGPRTEHEISERLLGRGYTPEAVRDAVERLRRVGLLDDRAFVRSFVRRELLRRAESGKLLAMKLRRHGVAPALVAELDAAIAEDPDLDAEALASEEGRARRALAQLVPRVRAPDPDARRLRLGRALVRRGFGWDTIRDVLNEEETESGTDAEDE